MLSVWQRTIATDRRAIPNAEVEVFIAGTATKPDLFADAEGNTPLTNPFNADANGFVKFYVKSGIYDITGSGNGGTITWSNYVVGQTFPVDSVDDLRGLIGAGQSSINLLGYSTPGDGGGGTLYWDASSTEADNGGTIFKPDSIDAADPGRWVRYGSMFESVFPLSDITSLSSLNTAALVKGQQFYRGEFWPDTGVGAVNITWDPNEPVANHNGGTIIDPAKISELNTTDKTFGTYFDADTVSGNTGCFVVSIEQSRILFDWYGVVPDGETDYHEVMQHVVDSVDGEYPIGFERRSGYVIDDTIEITSDRTAIVGNDTKIDCTGFRVGETSVDAMLFNVLGTEDSAISLTADVAKGSKTISISDASSLSEDDLILLYSDEPFADGAVGGNPRGELCWIQSISANDVTLHNHTHFSYSSTDGGAVRKQNPVRDVRIEGLDVTMGGIEKAHVFAAFDHCAFPVVENCKMRHCESRGVGMRWTYGGVVRDCLITDVTSPGESGGPATANAGYGVVIGAASRDCQVLDNFFRHCRDATSGGGLFATGPCLVRGNHTINAQFDCHEDCYLWTFDNNISTGDRAGFLARGQSSTVTNNIVIGTISGAFAGILIRPFGVDNPSGQRGCIVQGNRVYNTSGPGISLDGDQGTEIIDAIVSDNYVEQGGTFDATTNGINIYRVKNTTLSNNIVVSPGQKALRIRAGCDGITVDGGTYYGLSDDDAILVEDSANITFNGVTVQGGTNCIDFTNSTGLTVASGCTLIPDPGQDFNKALLFDNCSNINVSNSKGRGPNTPNNSANFVRLQNGCNSARIIGNGGDSWGKFVSVTDDTTDYVIVSLNDARDTTGTPSIDLGSVANFIKEHNFE